jgi:hypothetical protein
VLLDAVVHVDAACRHTQPGNKPVVLLHHGITLSSDGFVMYGKDESLGFILADAGGAAWMKPENTDLV